MNVLFRFCHEKGINAFNIDLPFSHSLFSWVFSNVRYDREPFQRFPGFLLSLSYSSSSFFTCIDIVKILHTLFPVRFMQNQTQRRRGI